MELITKANSKVIAFLKALDQIVNNVERIVDNCRLALNGEIFYLVP